MQNEERTINVFSNQRLKGDRLTLLILRAFGQNINGFLQLGVGSHSKRNDGMFQIDRRYQLDNVHQHECNNQQLQDPAAVTTVKKTKEG